jgi:hypothetical protein
LLSSAFQGQRESKFADPVKQGTKNHLLFLSNAIIFKSMWSNFLEISTYFHSVVKLNPTIEVIKTDFFLSSLLWSTNGKFSMFFEKYI